MSALLLAGCASTLVNYNGEEYGVAQKDVVCGSTFYVLTDDKVADQHGKKWPSVESWLVNAKLRTTGDQQAPAVVIQFYSHPNTACTHCDWSPDDRWTALMYTSRNTVSHFQLAGANRPGADPGKAFVEALTQLRGASGCSAG